MRRNLALALRLGQLDVWRGDEKKKKRSEGSEAEEGKRSREKIIDGKRAGPGPRHSDGSLPR